MNQDTDGALVARILAGDTAPFAILVRRYQDRMFRHARSMTGDPDVAADLVQDAFVRAYTQLGRCEDPERFGAWCFRILANRCKDHLRSPARRTEALKEAMVAVGGHSDAIRHIEQAETRAAVDSALAELPPPQRAAFLLKHVEGRSYEEMSELLDASVPALKMRVLRAREALQQRLRGVL